MSAKRWTHSSRLAITAVGVIVVVGLAGCASSSNSVVTAAVSTAGIARPASTGSSATAALTATASGDDCGGAVGRVTAAVAKFPEVTTVRTIAGCHEVDIRTNLPSGVLGSPSATTGAAICDAAARVAYQGDISSITVTAVDGHEIAAGLNAARCIPG